MGVIKVSGIKIYAYHGCMPEEELIGGWYEVDVEIEADINAAVSSDKLSDTVDYSKVNEIVRREMSIRSKLVEHIAGRIAKSLLKEISRIEEVKVKVSKMNPPVSGEVESFSVEIKEKRK
ncbi:MAG TPA: dihydroneopterin aldolase [Bacteroidia bacterium]|nr:dihydroneopterin aldolase [Bacteroidia bacterium]